MNKSIMWYQPAQLNGEDIMLADSEILQPGTAYQEAFDEMYRLSDFMADKKRPWHGKNRKLKLHYVKGNLNQVDEKGRMLSFDFISRQDCWEDELKKSIKAIGIEMDDGTTNCLKKKESRTLWKTIVAIILVAAGIVYAISLIKKTHKYKMIKQNQQSQVLLFADEDFIGGLNRPTTYYPEVKKQVELGNLIVADLLSAKNYTLDVPPIGDGSDLYLLNKYNGSYLKATNGDLLNKLIDDQSFAVKEALIYLGAKHIVIKESTSDVEKKEIDANANGGKNSLEIKANAHITWNLSVDIKTKIEFKDDQNRASDHQFARDWCHKHGLKGDTKIEMWLDRLEKKGSLSGTESYTVTYLSEVENAINVSLAINAKIFSSKLDFNSLHSHKYKKEKTLTVIF